MKLTRTQIAAVVAVASMAVAAPSAYAANVLEVDGLTTAADVAVTGPLVTGTTINFKTDFLVPSVCSTSAATGYVKRGVTVAAGVKIGGVTGLTLSGCTMSSLNYPIAISKYGTKEWSIVATATATATPTSKTQATIPVLITGIEAQMTSTGAPPYACELGASGTVTGTFNQYTQVLSITPATASTYPLPIQVYTGSGTRTPQPAGVGTCGGQFFTGDKVQLTGSFQLATPGVGGIHLQ